ncbi:serine/threonine-protein kinase [Cytobacillus firmus]|uniref:serine/threonine-protein kinase n=1 Tax=Cytobacillus firmus TaxID=1399 RepID=UPI0021616655|nr:serine/threonine-protein kinase [Cytobacillus firmus]MCS0674628.1 serine/threonine protein kinase [Cytobacillus firmus]
MSDLGEGAFAEVSTHKMENGEEVAVKRILDKFKYHENYTNRFKKEVQMLEKLSGHPNIVPLLEVRINEDEHEYAYVMAKARCNLSEFIGKNYGQLTDVHKIRLFDQVVEAITAAHSNNVLHRDLSPNNILINDRGTVWIADFGLGKDYDIRSIGGKSSLAGHGTDVYVAPEQLEKLRYATERSDVYSLGKIFYFILTGKTPPHVIVSVNKF